MTILPPSVTRLDADERVAELEARIIELEAKLKHRDECIVALGNVLENFSNLVMLSCQKMAASRGVMGNLGNPWD